MTHPRPAISPAATPTPAPAETVPGSTLTAELILSDPVVYAPIAVDYEEAVVLSTCGNSASKRFVLVCGMVALG